MVALRAPYESDDGPDAADLSDAADPSGDLPHADDDDWLTLPQAACEMGVSISTVRRLLRNGRLRNRIVPRRGGFKYLIHIPGNRHAAGGSLHLCEDGDPCAPIDIERARRQREIGQLQRQIEELSSALARALRSHHKAVPPGAASRTAATPRAASVAGSPGEPYARYRWLVRKRRWWPFD